jgi:hypothetical protein
VSSQFNTVRQWGPLVGFVSYWRDVAVNALDHFEKSQTSQLGLHTFAKMSSVLDPKYLEPLMTVMSAEKPNLSKVASAISLAARRQWYCWHVLCPDSPVHDERRMSLSVLHNCDV